MEFTGRILKVLPVQSGTGRNGEWRKQEFIFEYFEHETDRHSDMVLLRVMNDRIDQYNLKEGETVTIGFGHGVREWNGQYFNELKVYKVVRPRVLPNGGETETGGDLPPAPPVGGGMDSEASKGVTSPDPSCRRGEQTGSDEVGGHLPF